ncbi:outer membrane protein assembly factor BamB family protein [Actinomadura rudentiformis]|uniref:PQQ-binding-like beta-propeller repeat protein n=1 Tax=Actinomadura rudentiformis TaxID=359158 RepID=A0A6H9YS93_9ACTN|nr:PQQ-binding-like beta-propeller repeat protein [Actinomadura rudentiformis]KAB2350876.1 PQQ-binding-like beta-propeller repeat protein [Actinomadura rudentiformis]
MRFKEHEPSAGRTVAQLLVWAVLGILIGAAIVISVLGWIAVNIESGGSCGSGSCPNGSGLHFAAFFFAIVCCVPIVGAVVLVGMRLPAAIALVVALVAGGYGGTVLWAGVHGETYDEAWSAEPDRPSSLRGKGAWATAKLVVRVRTDGAIAYDLGNGTQSWAYQVPEPHVVCTMAETAADGIGLLAYGSDKGPCNQVAAVDLTSGKELWKTGLGKVMRYWRPGATGILATSTGSAVLPTDRGLRGLDLRTGQARWTWKAPKSCVFDSGLNALTASGAAVATTVQCGPDAAKTTVAVVDPRTGALRWSAPLPTAAKAEDTSVVSADPVVVYSKEPGERGRQQLVTFTPDGRQRAAFPTSTSEGDLQLYARDYGGMPIRTLRVQGDVIVAVAEGHRKYSWEADLVAFDFTGRELWRHKTSHGVDGLLTTADAVSLLTPRSLRNKAAELTVLSLASGKVTREITLLHGFAGDPALVFTAPGRYVFVQGGEDPKVPPVTAFRR